MKHSRRTNCHSVFLPLAVITLSLSSAVAQAQTFIENFDQPTGSNGQVLFKADTIYLASGATPSGGDKNGNSAYENGYVIQTNNFAPYTDPQFGHIITHDQSGSGYFLFEGTLAGAVPSFVGTFWRVYNPVSVTPNQNYVFSFYVTNWIPQNPAIIQPTINGVSLGASVSAQGYYGDGNSQHNWQQYSFNWNSGSATTADMSLMDLQTTGTGNDFGIDTISLRLASPVPEPGSIALLIGLATTGAGFLSHRRKAVHNAA